MGSANVDFLQTLNEIRTAIWQIPDNILARAPWHSFGDARSVALLCSSVALAKDWRRRVCLRLPTVPLAPN